MNNKSYFIIILLLITIPFYATNHINDDLIVNKISLVLIKKYDNYKNKTLLEKIVLKLGKNAFVDSVKIWEINYKDLDKIIIKLHPKLEYMALKGEKYLEIERAKYFRNLLDDLTLLGYENLQIYYIVIKEYLNEHNYNFNDINIDLIDEAVCQPEYYQEKKALYEKEDLIKEEIRIILREGKLKHKLALYSFAFDFFNKIRKKVIAKDLAKMLAKINSTNDPL
ncbi:MAG: hypothetical protein KAT05_02065 [Spirochaetes bacterium]|nr:hypothetical protein [Spirochaetota bacterium]